MCDHSTPEENIMQTFCWDNWEYNNGNNCSSEIVTSPAYLEERSLSINAFPGKVTTIPLKSFDDLRRNLTDSGVYAVEGTGINLRFSTDNTITIYGIPNTTTNLSS